MQNILIERLALPVITSMQGCFGPRIDYPPSTSRAFMWQILYQNETRVVFFSKGNSTEPSVSKQVGSSGQFVSSHLHVLALAYEVTASVLTSANPPPRPTPLEE